jgi:hypothetical protein
MPPHEGEHMSTLEKLACMQHRRDEVLNQQLAAELVRTKDRTAIREIAENLWNENADIANDCIKVIYEIGERQPDLVARYVGDFIELLRSKNNRMVWGAVTAIASVAHLTADTLFINHKEIEHAVENGSVITGDRGIVALAIVASQSTRYRKAIFPFLLKHLQVCRPKDIPQHSESTLIAVNTQTKSQFISLLKKRFSSLTPPQQKRVAKVIAQAELL